MAYVIDDILQGVGQWQSAKTAQDQIGKGMDENSALASQFRTEQGNVFNPYMQAGTQAMGDLQSFRMREPGSFQAQQFSGVDMSQDPGAQFRMQSGVNSLDASAANRGALFSGPQQKALMEFGQNLGSQEFGNSYNRQYGQFQDQENARRDQSNLEAMRMMNLDQSRMGQLQNLTGYGANAAGQYGGALQNIGSTEAANQMVLRGAMGDAAVARTAAPWMAGGSAAASAGQMGSNLNSYYMNK